MDATTATTTTTIDVGKRKSDGELPPPKRPKHNGHFAQAIPGDAEWLLQDGEGVFLSQNPHNSQGLLMPKKATRVAGPPMYNEPADDVWKKLLQLAPRTEALELVVRFLGMQDVHNGYVQGCARECIALYGEYKAAHPVAGEAEFNALVTFVVEKSAAYAQAIDKLAYATAVQAEFSKVFRTSPGKAFDFSSRTSLCNVLLVREPGYHVFLHRLGKASTWVMSPAVDLIVALRFLAGERFDAFKDGSAPIDQVVEYLLGLDAQLLGRSVTDAELDDILVTITLALAGLRFAQNRISQGPIVKLAFAAVGAPDAAAGGLLALERALDLIARSVRGDAISSEVEVRDAPMDNWWAALTAATIAAFATGAITEDQRKALESHHATYDKATDADPDYLAVCKEMDAFWAVAAEDTPELERSAAMARKVEAQVALWKKTFPPLLPL
jgi:hypothetical protein